MDEIRSLGGGSKSEAWCQIKADILGIPVKVIKNSASTPCMGCAILAGVANGIWPSIESAVEQFVEIEKKFMFQIWKMRKYMKKLTENMSRSHRR